MAPRELPYREAVRTPAGACMDAAAVLVLPTGATTPSPARPGPASGAGWGRGIFAYGACVRPARPAVPPAGLRRGALCLGWGLSRVVPPAVRSSGCNTHWREAAPSPAADPLTLSNTRS
jgi:hypothetical protein